MGRFGRLVLQIALGCLLVVGGIWALQGGGDFGAVAVRARFGGTIGMVFGIIELVAGALLILEVFVGDRFGKFDNILGWIIMIVWAVAIVLGDVMNFNSNNLLSWLHGFAMHLIVLGALWTLND